MKRVFLDANVLFSAAWRETGGLLRLWSLTGVELVTSEYAVREAELNLPDEVRRLRLQQLLHSVAVLPHPSAPSPLPSGVRLPAKDVPILQAAMCAEAAVLLTGDVTHFGTYFGKSLGGVLVLPPATFLAAG
jgi:predicted nucleic acid-binding protein